VAAVSEVWFWVAPADGGIVPDYPPVELSGYLLDYGIIYKDPDGAKILDPDAARTFDFATGAAIFRTGDLNAPELDCEACYDIAHDEMDEREYCDEHDPDTPTVNPA
jgi:hypothetical protein